MELKKSFFQYFDVTFINSAKMYQKSKKLAHKNDRNFWTSYRIEIICIPKESPKTRLCYQKNKNLVAWVFAKIILTPKHLFQRF